MTTKKALEFLAKSQWTRAMKAELVLLWNEERKELPNISMYDVSTPCRLRGIRDSMVKYYESKKPKTSKTKAKD